MNRSRIAIVIPARYSSTRLPGKPLLDIVGKPMIQRVYEIAQHVSSVDTIVVATDDARIRDAVLAFGGNSILTSTLHQNGTARTAEVAHQIVADLYVNIQGDEPLARHQDIELLINTLLEDPKTDVATLSHEIDSQEANNPNSVKVVSSTDGHAIYFSRAKIPYAARESHPGYHKHIGVYAYRRDALLAYANYPIGPLEQFEKLEQLRFLNAGLMIKVVPVAPTGPGVDTPECLERVRSIMKAQEGR